METNTNTLYHYTDIVSKDAVLASGFIQTSSMGDGDPVYGDGVYLTTMSPYTSTREDIYANNWNHLPDPEIIKQKTSYAFEIRLNSSKLKKVHFDRDVYLFTGESLKLNKVEAWKLIDCTADCLYHYTDKRGKDAILASISIKLNDTINGNKPCSNKVSLTLKTPEIFLKEPLRYFEQNVKTIYVFQIKLKSNLMPCTTDDRQVYITKEGTLNLQAIDEWRHWQVEINPSVVYSLKRRDFRSMSRERNDSLSRKRLRSRSMERRNRRSRSREKRVKRSMSMETINTRHRSMEKNKNRSTSRERSSSKLSERRNSRSRPTERSKSRSKSRERRNIRSLSKERSKSRSKSRERRNIRSIERIRRRSMSIERRNDRSISRERSRSRSKSSEIIRNRPISKERSKSRSKSRERKKSRSRSRERSKSRSKSIERRRIRSRSRERSKSRSKSRERRQFRPESIEINDIREGERRNYWGRYKKRNRSRSRSYSRSWSRERNNKSLERRDIRYGRRFSMSPYRPRLHRPIRNRDSRSRSMERRDFRSRSRERRGIRSRFIERMGFRARSRERRGIRSRERRYSRSMSRERSNSRSRRRRQINRSWDRLDGMSGKRNDSRNFQYRYRSDSMSRSRSNSDRDSVERHINICNKRDKYGRRYMDKSRVKCDEKINRDGDCIFEIRVKKILP